MLLCSSSRKFSIFKSLQKDERIKESKKGVKRHKF